MQDLDATASHQESVETQASRGTKTGRTKQLGGGRSQGGGESYNIEKSKCVARLTVLWDV